MKNKIKSIAIYLGLLTLTIFLASWGIAYVVKTNLPDCRIKPENTYVKLLNEFDKKQEPLLDPSIKIIGNGLYKAIQKCSNAGGITSLEGSGDIDLTCRTEENYGTVYDYIDWEFKGEKILK